MTKALDPKTLAEAVPSAAAALPEALARRLASAEDGRQLLAHALGAAADAHRALAEANRRIAVLEHQARTDPMTGLLNRRGFDIALSAALARTRRFGDRGVLVMIDLDGFKAVNDRYGHSAGDLMLSTVATLLIRHIRETDVAARLGGDEFALLLADAEPEGAAKRVRTLDRLLNYADMPWQGTRLPIRASFGMAPYGPADDGAALLDRANAAMYRRKQSNSAAER
jgi:diguanylate cyclase (GGDEF)-like protein